MGRKRPTAVSQGRATPVPQRVFGFQYGYLKPDVKAIVDQIVAELAGDENIRKLYDLWYEQREDVLRTYTDTFPKRIPLEQNKEFKSIRNAVIQEALKITPFIQRRVDVGQRLRIEEEQPFPEDQPLKGYEFYPPYPPHQQEEADDGDNDSAILEEQRPTETVDESERINPVEPVYIPSVARSVSALMAQLARLFQEQDQQRDRSQHQQIDRKQRQEISEKKQALGLRD